MLSFMRTTEEYNLNWLNGVLDKCPDFEDLSEFEALPDNTKAAMAGMASIGARNTATSYIAKLGATAGLMAVLAHWKLSQASTGD
jgi:hypothetical protein